MVVLSVRCKAAVLMWGNMSKFKSVSSVSMFFMIAPQSALM